MTYDVKTVDEYLEVIPEDRKESFLKLRKVILDNLPDGFEEVISYKFPSYVVPLSTYPAGYHCNPEEPLGLISIASQKHFIALYHMGIYSDPELLDWFKEEYTKSNSGKLDMGKSCIRFKNIRKIPYELIGELVAKVNVDQWIKVYERAIER